MFHTSVYWLPGKKIVSYYIIGAPDVSFRNVSIYSFEKIIEVSIDDGWNT